VQRRHVAIANKQLGPLGGGKIDAAQQPGGAIAAARAPDDVDIVIFYGLVHRGGPDFVSARELVIALSALRRRLRVGAGEFRHRPEYAQDVVLNPASGRDDADYAAL
jgi:hypothetical protein